MVWFASFATYWLKISNLFNFSDFLICLNKTDKIDLTSVCEAKLSTLPGTQQVHTLVISPGSLLNWQVSAY